MLLGREVPGHVLTFRHSLLTPCRVYIRTWPSLTLTDAKELDYVVQTHQLLKRSENRATKCATAISRLPGLGWR